MLSCHFTDYSEEQQVQAYSCNLAPYPKEKYWVEATALGFTFSDADGEGYLFDSPDWDLYFFERRSAWCLRKKTDPMRLGVGESPNRSVQDYQAKLDAAITALQTSSAQLQTMWLQMREALVK